MDNESHVRHFLTECTVRDLDDSEVLPVADLYGMYIIWCEQHDTAPLAVQVFSQMMRQEGIEAGVLRKEKSSRE
ncbi:primase-like DNA-binding domain-containing protein [Arthrobacter sp. ATA002]|uniref:primase-like DNA-binding domain-containing protein n=1 Tax=Arthrobacter sp. ATA002 TaxID=2991715 RepID=UPI0022A69493|nr:primase-like DNA-binding domain-containing protein [Arthrobacter sp. ATA002]WAP50694.1 primase-like DNA-binding domain-containing protein [Arthrobacter sp. ATA002]